MKKPESIHILMYPSDDPANEAFDTFRPQQTFLHPYLAVGYFFELTKIIPDLSFTEAFSTRVQNISEQEISRRVVQMHISSPFEKIIKCAIVEMKLHGEFDLSYGIFRGVHAHTLHILDFDPRTQRPETEYANVQSAYADLSLLIDTVKIITDGATVNWHRPFGHETHHIYAPYADKDGKTKYLVLSSFTML